MPEIVWAKMSGFPHWPSRYCTQPEVDTIGLKRSNSSREQVAVVFLGPQLERGWVNVSSTHPFTCESLATHLDRRKFKLDRFFRFGVIEGLRLLRASGVKIPHHIKEFVESYEEVIWDRSDVCSVCRGTEFSGDSLICDKCNTNETHLHCLSVPIIEAPLGDWYCPPCCKKLHLPPDYMPPIHTQSVSSGKKRGRKRKNSVSAEENNNNNAMTQSDTGAKSSTEQPAATSTTNTTPTLPADISDGNAVCLVCHLSGAVAEMQSCSVDTCSAYYHTTCIYAHMPTSLPMPTAQWVCPRHHCSLCLTNTTPITNCACCPFSACSSCNHNLLEPLQLFDGCAGGVVAAVQRDVKTTRATSAQQKEEDKPASYDICVHCSPTPVAGLTLSRLLERCWATIVSNQLAQPFLRPLFGGGLATSAENKRDSESSDVDESGEDSISNVENFLDIVDRIRNQSYAHFDDFISDIRTLRSHIIAVLLQHYTITSHIPLSLNQHALVQAFDTITSSMLNISEERKYSLLSQVMRERYVAGVGWITLNISEASIQAVQPLVLKRMHTRRLSHMSGSDTPSSIGVSTWRREMVTTSPPLYLLPPRSIVSWCDIIRQIECNAIAAPKSKGEKYIKTKVTEIQRMQTAESIAVSSLLSLPHDNISNSSESGLGKEEASGDRIMTALERLNRMTEAMGELQEQLRYDVLDHRRAVLHGEGQNRDIAIGDLHLLRELHLVNNNLKAQLHQKNMALEGARCIIAHLEQENKELRSAASSGRKST